MEERRTLQRFDLQAPTRVEVELEGGKRDVLSLATRDISSAGAFIATNQPLTAGMHVRLEMLLSLDMLKRFVGEGGKAKVRVKGKVIRSDSNGMAILFDSKYKILGGNGVNNH